MGFSLSGRNTVVLFTIVFRICFCLGHAAKTWCESPYHLDARGNILTPSSHASCKKSDGEVVASYLPSLELDSLALNWASPLTGSTNISPSPLSP